MLHNFCYTVPTNVLAPRPRNPAQPLRMLQPSLTPPQLNAIFNPGQIPRLLSSTFDNGSCRPISAEM